MARFQIDAGERGYPSLLEATSRPPRTLYGVGDPGALVPGLAVVGSRKASPYGLSCARMFAGWAAAHGVTVISGAATGCDRAAQLAAIEAGGRTVAVLGCGADRDYPRSSAELLALVRAGAGAVVSELAWGTPALPGHFPARNRIIAGLALALLVVEAALPSGTFNTADHAVAAGRDVLAVPGSVFYAGSAGCNRLIRQGAAPIACVEDLADELCALGLVDDDARPGVPARAPAAAGTAAGAGRAPASVDEVLAALQADPMAVERLIDRLGVPADRVLCRVAELEAAGLVARYPDGTYGPCAAR